MSGRRLRAFFMGGNRPGGRRHHGLFGCMACGLLIKVVILTPWVDARAASEKGVEAKGIVSNDRKSAKEFVKIDFEKADILQFIKFVGDVTEKRFVVDPQVNGTVTVFFPEPVPVEDLYGVFQSVLEVHGLTTVQAGSMVKIIPVSDARGKGVEMKDRSPSQ